jgi:hypothetical protein
MRLPFAKVSDVGDSQLPLEPRPLNRGWLPEEICGSSATKVREENQGHAFV